MVINGIIRLQIMNIKLLFIIKEVDTCHGRKSSFREQNVKFLHFFFGLRGLLVLWDSALNGMV